MSAFFVIAILLVGLFLIFAEVFFIPGTSLFGIVGGVALLIGVVMVYYYYGKTWGNAALVSSAGLTLIAIFMGFKMVQSNKLAMKAEIDSKVNELEVPGIEAGQTGKTITELRPNGKALIAGNKVEVFSIGDYISRDTDIEVVKIDRNKILVKPQNT